MPSAENQHHVQAMIAKLVTHDLPGCNSVWCADRVATHHFRLDAALQIQSNCANVSYARRAEILFLHSQTPPLMVVVVFVIYLNTSVSHSIQFGRRRLPKSQADPRKQ